MVSILGTVIIREDIKTVLLRAAPRDALRMWRYGFMGLGKEPETLSERTAVPAEKFPADNHTLSEELRSLYHASRKFVFCPDARAL